MQPDSISSNHVLNAKWWAVRNYVQREKQAVPKTFLFDSLEFLFKPLDLFI